MSLGDLFAYWSTFAYSASGTTHLERNKHPAAFYCEDARDVQIFKVPYAPQCSTLTTGEHLSVRVEGDTIEGIIMKATEALQDKAFYLEYNAILSYECSIDMWQEPMLCETTGTAAVLGKVR